MRRLMAKKVRSGFVTAWRLAGWPTSRSPSSVNATMDGVVRAPSWFSMTFGCAPSITATHELVVPRSIPMTLPMAGSLTFLSRPPSPEAARPMAVRVSRGGDPPIRSGWIKIWTIAPRFAADIGRRILARKTSVRAVGAASGRALGSSDAPSAGAVRQTACPVLGSRRDRGPSLRANIAGTMSRSRLSLGFAVLAVSTALAGEASAQGFFERLFGIRPAPAPVPPGAVPGRAAPPAPGPVPMPGAPGAPEAPAGAPTPGQPAPPAPPKPIVLKAPSEDGVVGRDLKLNGANGNLRIERAGAGLRARVTLKGAKASNPVESCSVDLGKGELLNLSGEGKPEGV